MPSYPIRTRARYKAAIFREAAIDRAVRATIPATLLLWQDELRAGHPPSDDILRFWAQQLHTLFHYHPIRDLPS